MEVKSRLNKYIAESGVCSRREADKLIEKGAVTVNEKPASCGMQVSNLDRIKINGKQISNHKNTKVVLAYYKPVGVVCTENDRHAKRMVKDEIDFHTRVTYAGRLDKESEGLLLMTNDGDLINAMMKGSKKHEKEYQVKVNREVTEDFLKKMQEGIYLKELETTTRECKCEKTGKNTFKIILSQGLNRQIRRMCESLQYQVLSLKRIRVLSVKIAGLKPGDYRKLNPGEMKRLYEDCGMKL